LFEQLRPSDVMTGLKLRIAMPPQLFAIRVQEIAEPRFEVAGDVPDDDRNGITATGPALPQLVIAKLAHGALTERFVPAPFAFNGRNDVSHLRAAYCNSRSVDNSSSVGGCVSRRLSETLSGHAVASRT